MKKNYKNIMILILILIFLAALAGAAGYEVGSAAGSMVAPKIVNTLE